MKKHWIYIKRGLSEDPKHREAMGECIWLYMHIIDRADWETGIAYGWKDEQEAADMGMNVRTLREQRRKLDEMDYISCVQKQYSQDIVIKRWIDPRNYSGNVLNQGDVVMEPQGYIQGYTQGYTQGSSQDVTPTSDSYSKDSYSKKKGDAVDGLLFYGKQAKERGMDKVEELIQEMERGLKVNIQRSNSNQSVARKILADGHPFGQWLTWCMSDKWRASHLYLYAELARVWQEWPQAFKGKTEEKRAEHTDAELEQIQKIDWSVI